MKEFVTNYLASILPEGADPCAMLSFLVVLVIGTFLLSVLIRALTGKESGYNHALASALALLFAYTAMMWLYGGFLTEPIEKALSALPLINFDGEKVTLFDFSKTDFLIGCEQFLYTYVLSLILIWLDDMIPDSRNGVAWLILQMIITCATVFAYYAGTWFINQLLPDGLHQYAPFILVIIAAFTVALLVLGFIQGLLLKVVNPMLTEVGKFMTGHRLGKVLGKAFLCSVCLCVVSCLMVSNGLGTFILADMTFMVCLLPLLIIPALWFLVGHVLFNSPN